MRWGAKHSPTNRDGRNPEDPKDAIYNSSATLEMQNNLLCKTQTCKNAFLIGGRMICWLQLQCKGQVFLFMSHVLRCAKTLWIQHQESRTENVATIPAAAHPGIL